MKKTLIMESDDVTYAVTPEYLMYSILKECGINVGEWLPRLWGTMFKSLMEDLEKQGYVERVNTDESDNNRV